MVKAATVTLPMELDMLVLRHFVFGSVTITLISFLFRCTRFVMVDVVLLASVMTSQMGFDKSIFIFNIIHHSFNEMIIN